MTSPLVSFATPSPPSLPGLDIHVGLRHSVEPSLLLISKSLWVENLSPSRLQMPPTGGCYLPQHTGCPIESYPGCLMEFQRGIPESPSPACSSSDSPLSKWRSVPKHGPSGWSPKAPCPSRPASARHQSPVRTVYSIRPLSSFSTASREAGPPLPFIWGADGLKLIPLLSSPPILAHLMFPTE